MSSTILGNPMETNISVFSCADSFTRYMLDRGYQEMNEARSSIYRSLCFDQANRIQVTYCEGEETIVRCDTDEQFQAEQERAINFYKENM